MIAEGSAQARGDWILTAADAVGLAPQTSNGRFEGAVRLRLEEFLAANFNRPVTVLDLAAIAGLSRSRFMEAFGRTFGQPPHRYILKLRLERARQLLEATKLPISEVAALAGFNSQSHLTTAVRRHHGTTPRQIRIKLE